MNLPTADLKKKEPKNKPEKKIKKAVQKSKPNK